MSRSSIYSSPKAYFVYGVIIGLSTVFGMAGYIKDFFQSRHFSHPVQSSRQRLIDNTAADDDRLAQILHKNIRVLCWVLTQSSHLENKTIHIKTTWGKRCNIMLFFTSLPNQTFPTVGLFVPEGRKYLVQKTMKAFQYVFENYYYEANWFLKADDDTYVIVENLRHFLLDKNPNDPVYYGQHFHKYIDQGYNSGGAGYVLSKEALRRLVIDGMNADECVLKGAEDVRIGNCLSSVGVKVGETSDALRRSRFHAIIPEHVILGQFMTWYENFTSTQGGMESLSNYAITFHYVGPLAMQEMEYFLYYLRPYGIQRGMFNIN